MSSFLCLTIRFLQPYSHGRNENGDPEWPPSPLRMLQAMVAACAGHWNERSDLNCAVESLRRLESFPPPLVIAAAATPFDMPYRLYVPDNVADKVAGTWSRGGHASIADYRTEKDVRPTHLNGEAVHYLYPLPNGASHWSAFVKVLQQAARSITHLGWGIDMATGDASIITTDEAAKLEGEHWRPSPTGSTPLRVPKSGTLDDLIRKHNDFLNRVSPEGFRPVPPLRVFEIVRYRNQNDPAQRPFRIFELRNTDGARFRYPQFKLIHIAGMVRHLAIRAMASKSLLESLYPDQDRANDPFRDGSPPPGKSDDWVKTYVAGHAVPGAKNHRQLSYLPLPSLGHAHTDPGVRRVMIAAPVGDDALLDHVARRLAGQTLKPVRGCEFKGEPPFLVPLRNDNIARFYTAPANVWHSFTPVILPGHDDRKSNRTRQLIGRALIQSGIDQPCEVEWSRVSRFAKSGSTHQYLKPEYLRSRTAMHLTLRFPNAAVPGPLAIGAGRHCGLGIFASTGDGSSHRSKMVAAQAQSD